MNRSLPFGKLPAQRRWLIEVWYLMLEALTKPMRPIHLATALRLTNWRWVKENMEILEKAGFIKRSSNNNSLFETTDKGQAFMEYLGRLLEAKDALRSRKVARQ